MTETASPKVTICIPTIGRLTYLSETLASLESQLLQDYEVLILDSGSPLEAAETFQRIAEQDPRRRVIRGPRVSMFANFNLGLREARGEFIAFFHDDDLYDPDFLSTSLQLLQQNPGAGFSGSNYRIVDGSGRDKGLRKLIKKTEVKPGKEFIQDIISTGRNPVPLPGIVFRRTAFSSAGFNEMVSMHFGDYVVLMEIAERWDVLLIEQPLMRLRLHENNASNIPMSKSVPLLKAAFDRYLSEYSQRWPADLPHRKKIRKSAPSAYRRMLLWGWISADSEEEADRCIASLRSIGFTVVAGLISLVGRIGFSQPRRKAVLEPIVRKLGLTIS